MTNSNEFLWPIRVYYEDTDTAGVVYHGNYLNFMERARTEWLRAKGLEQDHLRANLGIIFTVTELSIRYRQAVRFNALLEVSVSLKKCRRASMLLGQKIYMNSDGIVGDTVYCDASVTIACVAADSFKPVAIPELIKKEILGEC